MEHFTYSPITSPEKSLEKELFSRNLFLKNTQELKSYLGTVHEYITQHTEKEIRKAQLDNYYTFIKDVLHLDPQDDPHQQITGKTLEELYMRQAEIGQNLEYVKMINGARTLIISGDILQDEHISHGFFDPLTLVPEKDWILQFGFINSFHENIFLGQGAILLEPEVVHTLETYDTRGVITSYLGDVMNWFNHDITAHGVFLPAQHTLDEGIVEANSETFPFFQKAHRGNYKESFRSAVVGEMWSLNLHENLFHKMVEQRPAIARFLSQHLHKYIHEVELLVERQNNPDQGPYLRDYLIKAYAFPFFRLLNPKELRAQEPYRDIFEKYPDIDNLGPSEEHVRDYVFGTSGIQNPKNYEEYIPHQEYVQRIFDAQIPVLETRVEYLKIRESYSETIADLFSDEGVFSKDHLELFRKYLSQESKNIITKLLDKALHCRHEVGETFYFLVNKNKQEVINFLIEHPGDQTTFMDRLYRHIYGFGGPSIKLNHFQKEKKILNNSLEE